MKVKICGIQDLQTALLAIEAGADAIGFVFAKSKRTITPEKAEQIAKHFPSHILKIGVFVNEPLEQLTRIHKQVGLDYVQCHGDESVEFMKSLPFQAIKAVGISSINDIKYANHYGTDFLLFDSPKGEYEGGTGTKFTWELLQKSSVGKNRMILAGGLTPENVAEAIKIVKPFMVDVSSGVETDGRKDIDKIREFIIRAKEFTLKEEY
jgi:phosphoribosylanthranilate isomerase